MAAEGAVFSNWYGQASCTAGRTWRYDEATKQGWAVITTKRDWKRIFAFEP